jgi:hypothetical protein
MEVHDWYDSDHLIVLRSPDEKGEALVVDLTGKNARVLVRDTGTLHLRYLHFTPLPGPTDQAAPPSTTPSSPR